MRVIVADDQALLRAGFARLLEAEADIEVVGEAVNGREAVDQTRSLRPDVVMMDIRMPVLDGIAATREITSAQPTRVLVLTTYDRDEYVYAALEAGASGFLLKDCPPADLIRALHTVAAGEALLAPAVTRRLIADLVAVRATHRDASAELARLTERELEVLHLLAAGRSNAEIARSLFVGETTVKTHVAAVLTKLRLRDRVHVVVYAYECGLVRPGSAS
ncbi:MAG TPA: response regulator transcription factor [Nocardioides sp.]|nr:response regulator transcription factor [Nocardioides sp.]